MGCDIHYVIEVKDKDMGSDEWVGVYGSGNPFNLPYDPKNPYPFDTLGFRDYDFFGAIAGVRRAGPPAKGLPDDMSSMAKMYSNMWEDDAHSHSYLPLKDFIHLKIKTNPILTAEAVKMKFKGEDPVNWMLDHYGEWVSHVGIDNFRVVFWFDN